MNYKFSLLLFATLSLLITCDLLHGAGNLANTTIVLSCYSDITRTNSLQPSVIFEDSDHKLNLVVATEPNRISNSHLTLYFFALDTFKWPEPTVMLLEAPISDWHIAEDICWIALDEHCSEREREALRGLAVHEVPTNTQTKTALVEILTRRHDGLTVPFKIKCPFVKRPDGLDDTCLQLDWTAECLGAPVFSLSTEGQQLDFLGLLTSQDEGHFRFLKSSTIFQRLNGNTSQTTDAAADSNTPNDFNVIRAQATRSTGITLLSAPPNFIAICPTQSLNDKSALGSRLKTGKDRATALLDGLYENKSSSWSASEYAYSFRVIFADDYSAEDKQLLDSLSYEIAIPQSGPLRTGYVQSLDSIGPCFHECLLNYSPTAFGPLASVTSHFEDLAAGQPIFALNDAGSATVSGFVVDVMRYPAIVLGYKDSLCGGRFIPIGQALRSLPTLASENLNLTPDDSSGLDLSNYCCVFNMGTDVGNGCIVRTDQGYFLVTARHVIEPHINADFELRIPNQQKTNLEFQQFASIKLHHAGLHWRIETSDVAVAQFNISMYDQALVDAIDRSALILDNKQTEALAPAQDAYVVTNWKTRQFVYRNTITSPCLADRSNYKQSLFGIYPGLLRGTSGSPVIQLNKGSTPILLGLVSLGLYAGDDMLANFCVSSNEIEQLTKSKSQFTLPPN